MLFNLHIINRKGLTDISWHIFTPFFIPGYHREYEYSSASNSHVQAIRKPNFSGNSENKYLKKFLNFCQLLGCRKIGPNFSNLYESLIMSWITPFPNQPITPPFVGAITDCIRKGSNLNHLSEIDCLRSSQLLICRPFL